MVNKGQQLPDDHHVMRFVPWNRLRKDEDDNVLGFLPQAFQLRDGEDALSVNWLEHFDGDRQQQVNKSVHAFRNSVQVGKKSAFGIARVKTVKDTCRASDVSVRIVFAPSHSNSAHSLIKHLPRDDLQLLDDLAADAFTELVHNNSVP